MEKYEYGDPAAANVLIQPAGGHELPWIEDEAAAIRQLAKADFRLVAVAVSDWNADLSPWKAPAVFGTEGFCGGAEAFLDGLLRLCADQSKTYLIGGYSLAGLFALWAAYQTDRFAGVAAASPSVWFPGFLNYMQGGRIRSGCVYLSLGDREERTRNPAMAAVGGCIRAGYEALKAQGVNCILEWNRGSHFKDAGLRTAKAFAWTLDALRR